MIYLAGCLAGVGMPIVSKALVSPTEKKSRTKKKTELWLSAHGDSPAAHGVGWLGSGSDFGATNVQAGAHSILTGFRGHALAVHPQRESSVLMFARRPGTQGLEIDVISGRIVRRFDCAAGRHLLGHGCFSRDGQYLFTTESDFEKGIGKIVVRDAMTYKTLDEWPSYGVGPHELKVMPNGRSIVVANGGIRTHPKQGRKALNLDTMVSTLSYIDLNNGQLLEEYHHPEPKVSIRHLDITLDGSVVFAGQMQREAAGHADVVALSGVHRLGGEAKLFRQPVQIIDQFKDYVGSVAFCEHSRIAGFTSPRGNVVAFWHIEKEIFVGYHRLRDVCGIAVSNDQRNFVISSSFGQMRVLDSTSVKERRDKRLSAPQYQWDNHLLVLDMA